MQAHVQVFHRMAVNMQSPLTPSSKAVAAVALVNGQQQQTVSSIKADGVSNMALAKEFPACIY